jgi:hypothetical protein
MHNKILTFLVLLWASFAIGYFGYRIWHSEQEAGDSLMEQHRLKHEAIEAQLDNKKR